MSGYKFEDAHIKLGSKIHIKDFYYAKRMFQNSFYALRFAYLASQHINKDLLKSSELSGADPQDRKISVLGYGLYSELLVSNISRFLNKLPISSAYTFNHLLIDDAEEPKLNNKENLEKKIILIVPIASTLSTSLKVERRIKEAGEEFKLIGTPINILIVGNESFEDILDEDKETVKDEVVRNFWSKVDLTEKVISPKKSKRGERFFLYLPSKWYMPNKCELCYPKNPVQEVVLFETDKTSVTPKLIFDLPLPKEPSKNSLSAELIFDTQNPRANDRAWMSVDMVKYGHFERGRNHYLFYLDTVEFYEKNIGAIKQWLERARTEIETTRGYIFESKIIIVAPAHDTNASFISLLNEIVFSDVATILHYDPKDDYIQNFVKFFKEDISIGGDNAKEGNGNKTPVIFFADDALSSGSTFYEINDFIKYARKGSGAPAKKGLDGAFVLLDRMTKNRNSVLKDQIDDFYYPFASLESPIIKDPNKFCHICEEKKFYEEILEVSMTDALRIEFCKKAIKLREDNLDKDDMKTIEAKKEDLDPEYRMGAGKKERYLFRLKAVHNLYKMFGERDNNGFNVKEFFQGENAQGLKAIIENLGYERHEGAYNRIKILKILSQPHFIFHKNIKKKIFQLLLIELEGVITGFKEIDVESVQLTHSLLEDFRYSKFLIKRLAHLKANYIISESFFQDVACLYPKMEKLHQKSLELQRDIDNYIKENSPSSSHDATNIKTDKATTPKQGEFPFVDERDDKLTKQLKDKETIIERLEVIRNAPNKEMRPEFFKVEKAKLKRFSNGIIRFNLIFAQAIKEMVVESETMTIKLEETLDALQVDQAGGDTFHSDFKSLLRLLRLENVNIVQHFMGFTNDLDGLKLKFARKDLDEDLEKIKAKVVPTNMPSHYKFFPLLQFLGFENQDRSAGDFLDNNNIFKERILPMLLLGNFLKDDRESFGNISDKMNYILFILCKIIGINTNTGGAFFAVRQTGNDDSIDDAESLFVAGHVGNSKDGFESLDFNDSWTKKILDGFDPYDSTNSGSPWTNDVITINRETSKVSSLSGEERDLKEFVEGQMVPDMSRFLFLRFSDLQRTSPRKDKINIEGKGVCVFYNNGNEAFSPESLRYVLILRDSICNFLKKHYENDSFRALIEEHKRRNLLAAMGHDFTRYVTGLKREFDETNPPDDVRRRFEVCHSLVRNRVWFAQIGRQLISNDKFEDILGDENYKKEKINLKEFLEQDVKNFIVDIYDDIKLDRQRCITPIIDAQNIIVNCYTQLLKDIIFEFVVNAKKHVHEGAAAGKPTLKLTVTDVPTEKHCILTIKDNGKGVDTAELAQLNKRYYLKVQGGLALIATLWSRLFRQKLQFESKKFEYFKVSMVIPYDWRQR